MKQRPIQKTIVTLTVGMLISVPGCSRAQNDPPASREVVIAQIDAKLQALSDKGFAGSVVLADRGKVLLSKGYGFADRAARRPVTRETGFDIGSLVKPFTAMAIRRLESQGKLRLSAAISSILPSVPPDKARMTIDQLVTHRSGLPDIVDAKSKPIEYTPDFDFEPVSRDEIVRRAMKSKLTFDPGTKTEYSNMGYSLLGVIIEIASGQTYEEFVQQQFLVPAGMTRTGYFFPHWRSPDLAVGYVGDKPWGTPLEHSWLADGPSWNLRANGGMLSTADDLLKWTEAIESGKLLSPAEQEWYYAINATKNKRGTRTIGPSGGNDIFNATYLWYLDEHRVIVMLTSSDKFRSEKLVPDVAAQMRRIISDSTPSARGPNGPAGSSATLRPSP